MSKDELRRMINNIAVEVHLYGCENDRTDAELERTNKICSLLNEAYQRVNK